MHTIMLTLAIVLATLAGSGYSQPNPPQNPQNNPDAVPISGIEYLLLTGILYGVYRLTIRRNTLSDKKDSPSPKTT
jgi:hypothetical protein